MGAVSVGVRRGVTLTLSLFLMACGPSLSRELERAQALLYDGDIQGAVLKYEDALRQAHEKGEPISVEIYRDLAKAYEDLGHYQNAIHTYQIVIQKGADDAAAIYAHIGDLHRAQRAMEAAAEAYIQAVEAAPDHAPYAKTLRDLLESMNEAQRYIDVMARLWDDTADGGKWLKEMGDGYFAQGQVPLAQYAWQASLTLAPQQHDLRLRVAYLQRKSGDLQGASQSFEAYLHHKNDDLRILRVLAETQEDLGNYAGALKTLRQAETLDPQSWPLKALILLNAHRVGEISNGLKALKQLSRQSVTHAESWLAIARLEIEEAQWKAALRALEAIDPSQDEFHEAQLLRGVIEMARGQDELALSHLLKAQDIRFWDPEPHLALCALYNQKRRVEKALDACRQALKMAPELPDLRRQTALLEIAAGHYATGLVAMGEAAQNEPAPSPTQIQFIHILLTLGGLDEAEGWIGKLEAPQKSPVAGDILVLKARLALAKGEMAAARSQIAQALALNPRDIMARSVLVDVEIADDALARASQELQTLLALAPGALWVRLAEVKLLLARGEVKRAHGLAQSLASLYPEQIHAQWVWAQALGAAGFEGESQALILQLEGALGAPEAQ